MASRRSPEGHAEIARKGGDEVEVLAEEPKEIPGFGETDHSSVWPEDSGGKRWGTEYRKSLKQGCGRHRGLSLQGFVAPVRLDLTWSI